MTIDDVIDCVVCLLCSFSIFDKIENDIINQPLSLKKKWSVKSVYVSKLIICSYAEVTVGCGFDLFLRKFGSVSQV